MNCDECAHYFEPRFDCIGIHEVKKALLAAISPTVWVVWRGKRYPVRSFHKVNYSWCLWSEGNPYGDPPMNLAKMIRELKKRENWEGLHNYSLSVHISEPDEWARVLRIEETRTMPNLEDDGEAEDITGEVLIYVHTEEDVKLAWEAAQ